MERSLLDAIAAEAGANPMGQGPVRLLQNRRLFIDGDALAYSMAGSGDTPLGLAASNLKDKVAAAAAITGAGATLILLTGQGSHKGFRYAVARQKPYQGHRSNARKPANWEALRNGLELGAYGPIEYTQIAEADDLFGKYAGADSVIYTEDKDMRMLPGIHLNWGTHTVVTVPEGTWALEHDDKLYGRKWFWTQMLQGDSADNIPGLPRFEGKLVGPATAKNILAMADNEGEARSIVANAYLDFYGASWAVEMLEQGILLWIRRDWYSSPWDVMAKGNPLHFLRTEDRAISVIRERMKDSLQYDPTQSK